MVKYVNSPRVATSGKNGGSRKGRASSGATQRPVEWSKRRRIAAAPFLMGADAEGKANVKHRPRIRTPQMRDPPLLGRGFPRLYRGGFGGGPISPYKQDGGRVKDGRQEARSSGWPHGEGATASRRRPVRWALLRMARRIPHISPEYVRRRFGSRHFAAAPC